MTDSIKLYFKRYTDFQGRSSVSDYWWVVLGNILVYLLFYLVGLFVGPSDASLSGALWGIILMIWYLATLIPNLSLSVRRLHDSGKSGRYLLLGLIGIGLLILIILFCSLSDPEGNKYGRPPDQQNKDFI
tara:strand:- start:50 stop:439 length:390 start_codon:yes stop_codon:yes gene_type:complete